MILLACIYLKMYSTCINVPSLIKEMYIVHLSGEN